MPSQVVVKGLLGGGGAVLPRSSLVDVLEDARDKWECLRKDERCAIVGGVNDEQNKIVKLCCIKNNIAHLSINSILHRTCYTRHGAWTSSKWKGKDVMCSMMENYLSYSDLPPTGDMADSINSNTRGLESKGLYYNLDIRSKFQQARNRTDQITK